ncbi:MAG TPA: NAD(P)H-binding protein [Rubrobacteraceae bacterium]|nr:NAD(P)H-binding protein [Rubrobacteraceae bacterium]
MNAPTFLVTGGTGSLGRLVSRGLRDAGHDVRVLSHSGRSGTVRGDLLTGEGLDEATSGIDTIVHCASNPRDARHADVEGTGRLLRAAERSDVAHLVYISIVGVDRNPLAYYRAKLDAERVVERSAVPWTILRATQFHHFVLGMLRPLDCVPLFMPVPRGFLFQPVDAGEVADRLVELSLSEPGGRVGDMGGPEVRTAASLAGAYLKAMGRRKRVLEVPLPGKTARAVRNGAQLAPESMWGTLTWKEFLVRTINAKPG